MHATACSSRLGWLTRGSVCRGDQLLDILAKPSAREASKVEAFRWDEHEGDAGLVAVCVARLIG